MLHSHYKSRLHRTRVEIPCSILCGQSLASHRGGWSSGPRQSMCNLWFTMRYRSSLYYESCGYSLSMSFHRCSIFTHLSSGGWTRGPSAVAVARRLGLTLSQPQKKNVFERNCIGLIFSPFLFMYLHIICTRLVSNPVRQETFMQITLSHIGDIYQKILIFLR